MRTRYLLGVIAVLVLLLAIWVVPMALAGSGDGTPKPDQSKSAGTECPFLQAHPWLDPHPGAGGAGGSTGASQVIYH